MIRIRTFQGLVLATTVLYVVWFFSPDWIRYLDDIEQEAMRNAGYGAALPVYHPLYYGTWFVLWIAAAFGMIALQNWARFLYLSLAVAGIGVTFYSGLIVQSPLDGVYTIATSILDGVVLCIAFLTPLADNFTKGKRHKRPAKKAPLPLRAAASRKNKGVGTTSNLLANLRAGLRASFFTYVDPRSVVPTPGQLTLIVVVSFFITVALTRTFYSSPASFNWASIRDVWLWFAVFLLVGWLASRYAAQKLPALSTVVVLCAATIVLHVVSTAAYHSLTLFETDSTHGVRGAIYFAIYLWLIAIGAVFARRSGKLAAMHVASIVMIMLTASLYSIFWPQGQMWYSTKTKAAEKISANRDSPVREEILHLQPALTQQTIQALLPQRKNVEEIYFVGFSPYSYQDVFLKESEVIRTLMDQRFDTSGRSLLLVNNDKTLRRYPLATVTNLRGALSRVGKLMNKEQDVLVLYVTSHGSAKHELSVDYWPLDLDELNPPLLKRLLDESGIKWRVVVISACYSGGFIEPLRGPTTLVMTAADANKTSFGCGAESDFTYFAKAVFDEQLRKTFSFEEAFKQALPIIREREKKVSEEFSNPQIDVGDAIRVKLRAIERRLQTRQ